MKKKRIKYVFIALIVAIVSICFYEVHISYNNLTTTNYTISSNKINNDVNMVILSDLHENNFGENNKELINSIKKQNPDVILVVGDMINKDSDNTKIVTSLMKQLNKIAPVFYSLGNTEYDNIEVFNSNIIKELEKVSAIVLDKEYRDIKIKNTSLRIGGMYDYAFYLDEKGDTYNFLCDFQNTDSYKIMMAHRPDSFIFGNASKIWDVDLVVSGHTHGGQVRVPFKGGLYVGDQGWFPKYDKGLFDLNNIKILITSGLGSGKQKVPRFNNPPEVVDLRLSNK